MLRQRFSSSLLLLLLLLFVSGFETISGSEDVTPEKATKPEVSEQIDPNLYIRQNGGGYFPGMNIGLGMAGTGGFNQQPSLQYQANNFAFTCKCNSKSANPLGTPVPIDANQLAQQQIVQLQEQVRRQQEIINRQNMNRNGFDNFAQLIALANSLECSCSSDASPSNVAQPNMGGLYSGQGLGGGGYPPITANSGGGGFGYPTVQRGVQLASFAGTQPMIELPFAKNK